MHSRRFVVAALLAFFAVACSGGEEQVVPEQTSTTTAAPAAELREPASTVAPEATVPASTTIASPADDVPDSLAFASTKDIGRLFEVTGSGVVLDGPSGELAASLGDGTLVQAAAARATGDELMVGIVDPLEPSVALGWINADDLRPTTRTVLTSDPEIAAQLRQARRGPGADDVPVYTAPATNSSVVRTLANREIAMHGGNETIAADGSQWLDVIDSNTRSLIGWVPIDQFLILTSNSAMDDEQIDTDRRADSAISYGAPLPAGQIVSVGCNATQIAFSNSSSSGLALVFGTEVPVAAQTGDTEVWQATGGTRLFVEPGATMTLTVATDGPRTWYFTGLDETFRAPSVPSLVDGLVEATSYQEIALPGGSCVYEAPIPEDAEYDVEPDLDDSVEPDPDELSEELNDGSDQDLESAPEADASTAETPDTTEDVPTDDGG